MKTKLVLLLTTLCVTALAATDWSKTLGAISCYGHVFGGVFAQGEKRPIHYWLTIQLFENKTLADARSESLRPVQPRDVQIFSEQEPVIVKTNLEQSGKSGWLITFKE